MKGFALGLALKQRRKATRKSPIVYLSQTYEFLLYCLVQKRFLQFIARGNNNKLYQSFVSRFWSRITANHPATTSGPHRVMKTTCTWSKLHIFSDQNIETNNQCILLLSLSCIVIYFFFMQALLPNVESLKLSQNCIEDIEHLQVNRHKGIVSKYTVYLITEIDCYLQIALSFGGI